MNQSQNEPNLEDTLHHAAHPVTPLDPERSAQILANALREQRRKNGNGSPWWMGNRPWTVAIGTLAFGGIAFFASSLPGQQEFSSQPMVHRPMGTQNLLTQAPSNRTSEEAPEISPRKPVPHSEHRQRTDTVPGAVPTGMRRLPSALPRRVRPLIQMASHHIPTAPRQRPLAPATTVPDRNISPEPKTAATDDSALLVAVTGLPAESDQEENLKVAVSENVPTNVPGYAEAASLQSVPVEGATASGAESSVPVWTHVRVHTGQEPVLTVTALR